MLHPVDVGQCAGDEMTCHGSPVVEPTIGVRRRPHDDSPAPGRSLVPLRVARPGPPPSRCRARLPDCSRPTTDRFRRRRTGRIRPPRVPYHHHLGQRIRCDPFAHPHTPADRRRAWRPRSAASSTGTNHPSPWVIVVRTPASAASTCTWPRSPSTTGSPRPACSACGPNRPGAPGRHDGVGSRPPPRRRPRPGVHPLARRGRPRRWLRVVGCGSSRSTTTTRSSGSTRQRPPGSCAISSSDDPRPRRGLTVDALHRMLDLPSPGDPPPTPLMALAVWSQDLIERLLDGQHLTWPDAVALPPGAPSGARSRPRSRRWSEANLATQGSISWGTTAPTGAGRPRPASTCRPRDRLDGPVVLYARWVVDSLPDADLAGRTWLRPHRRAGRRLVTAVALQVTAALESVNRG